VKGAVALVAVIAAFLAGCGGSSSFDWRDVEIHGNELWLPDGTIIDVQVSGKLPAACDPDMPAGTSFDCLQVSTSHGCEFQKFRVDDTFGAMMLGPPHPEDQHSLVLDIPVEPTDCEG
jgi:hypothetical protein